MYFQLHLARKKLNLAKSALKITYNVFIEIGVIGPLGKCIIVRNADFIFRHIAIGVLGPLGYDSTDAELLGEGYLYPSS